jgi:transcriptional regulator with XRE-family HTH domain
MLEDKEVYTLRELIESLPYSLRQIGKDHNISEVTIARIRDGKPAIRSTINKLLSALSSVYGKTLTLHNVRGISIRGEVPNEEEKSKVETSTEEEQPEAASDRLASPLPEEAQRQQAHNH